jgi:hypothetical protein
MVFPAKKPVGTDVDTSETTGDHHWSCPVDGCPQNYSPSLGYFAIEKSLDYWHVWLANCYFAHNSLRFPALLPFFNAGWVEGKRHAP